MRTPRRLIAPPPVCPGDKITVVAPAGAFNAALFYQGLSFLSQHFRLARPLPHATERSSFLASPTQARRAALNAALACPDTRMVLATRGGVGCTDILEQIDWASLRRHPKWLVGFSDITALHLGWQSQAGLCSIHAQNVTGLGPSDAQARAAWLRGVLEPLRHCCFQVKPLRGGYARGPLAGGNLAVLAASSASPGYRPPQGAVIFLEEVSEAPYRNYRALRQLESAGFFDDAVGLVIGHLTQCGDPVAALQPFRDLAERLNLPCRHGLPCGHERPNQPLTLGLRATLDGSRFELGA